MWTNTPCTILYGASCPLHSSEHVAAGAPSIITCLPSYIDNVYDIVHRARVVMIPLFVLRWWGHLSFINISESFTAPEGKRGFYCSYYYSF